MTADDLWYSRIDPDISADWTVTRTVSELNIAIAVDVSDSVKSVRHRGFGTVSITQAKAAFPAVSVTPGTYAFNGQGTYGERLYPAPTVSADSTVTGGAR